MRIDVDDTHLSLVVTDDGVGVGAAAARRRGGYGLGSMRARFAWHALIAARTPAAARKVRKEAR
ncbi:hypothetical protein BMA10399_D0952 [Burkholderia mallei ATCC 10399]|nr:hypothetical protein BMA10399_D0952 [Burkholderia mallei ATCC 10399]